MSKNFSFGMRKIQKSNYSYWITLPLAWLENHKLEKNSEIIIEMNNERHLIIKPKGE